MISAFLFTSFQLIGAQAKQSGDPAAENKFVLAEGWALQSSAKVEQKGEEISSAGFEPKGWRDVTVPTTVVAAMVKDKFLRTQCSA